MTILGKVFNGGLTKNAAIKVGTIDEPGTINIRIVNRNPPVGGAAADAKVRVAISTNASAPTVDDYTIEYDATVQYGTPLDNCGISVSQGEYVYIWTDSDNCCARINGMPAQ